MIRKGQRSYFWLFDDPKIYILTPFVQSLTEVDCGSKMGDIVGQIHASGIVHGDLTTSNFMMEGDKALVIDFGLGEFFPVKVYVSLYDFYFV